VRHSIVPLAVLAAALAASGCSPEPVNERPNVVLIIIDTLRADKLSSYGHPADPSPALTRLAKNGVQFDSVLAQTSWTLPSVGSMLTSQYPRTLGLYVEGGGIVPDRFDTLAEVLQANGYRTFGITANPNLNSRANFHQGFDEYVDSVVVYVESRDQVPEGKVFFRDATLHKAPEIFAKTLDYVDATDSEGPYFLLIDVMEVHEHYSREMLRDEYAQGFEGREDAAYLRKVRQVTDDIERFVHDLRDRRGWRNTLFIVTSDHGEGLHDHPDVEPSRGHGSLLYESNVRVPWVLFNETWTPPNRRIAQDVRLLELAPTVLDYLDIPPPSDMQGVSLLPLIEGTAERADIPELIVTETYFRGLRKISANSARWQYVNNRAQMTGVPEHELQPRGSAPNGTRTDQSAAHAEEVERMRAFIAEWERTHAEAPATAHVEELTDEEREQLGAVGYIEGPSEGALDGER
jgi:arylsulfatase A-like enzyme